MHSFALPFGRRSTLAPSILGSDEAGANDDLMGLFHAWDLNAIQQHFGKPDRRLVDVLLCKTGHKITQTKPGRRGWQIFKKVDICQACGSAIQTESWHCHHGCDHYVCDSCFRKGVWAVHNKCAEIGYESFGGNVDESEDQGDALSRSHGLCACHPLRLRVRMGANVEPKFRKASGNVVSCDFIDDALPGQIKSLCKKLGINTSSREFVLTRVFNNRTLVMTDIRDLFALDDKACTLTLECAETLICDALEDVQNRSQSECRDAKARDQLTLAVEHLLDVITERNPELPQLAVNNNAVRVLMQAAACAGHRPQGDGRPGPADAVATCLNYLIKLERTNDLDISVVQQILKAASQKTDGSLTVGQAAFRSCLRELFDIVDLELDQIGAPPRSTLGLLWYLLSVRVHGNDDEFHDCDADTKDSFDVGQIIALDMKDAIDDNTWELLVACVKEDDIPQFFKESAKMLLSKLHANLRDVGKDEEWLADIQDIQEKIEGLEIGCQAATDTGVVFSQLVAPLADMLVQNNLSTTEVNQLRSDLSRARSTKLALDAAVEKWRTAALALLPFATGEALLVPACEEDTEIIKPEELDNLVRHGGFFLTESHSQHLHHCMFHQVVRDATCHDHIKIVDLVGALCPHPDSPDHAGKTPLDYARENGWFPQDLDGSSVLVRAVERSINRYRNGTLLRSAPPLSAPGPVCEDAVLSARQSPGDTGFACGDASAQPPSATRTISGASSHTESEQPPMLTRAVSGGSTCSETGSVPIPLRTVTGDLTHSENVPIATRTITGDSTRSETGKLLAMQKKVMEGDRERAKLEKELESLRRELEAERSVSRQAVASHSLAGEQASDALEQPVRSHDQPDPPGSGLAGAGPPSHFKGKGKGTAPSTETSLSGEGKGLSSSTEAGLSHKGKGKPPSAEASPTGKGSPPSAEASPAGKQGPTGKGSKGPEGPPASGGKGPACPGGKGPAGPGGKGPGVKGPGGKSKSKGPVPTKEDLPNHNLKNMLWKRYVKDDADKTVWHEIDNQTYEQILALVPRDELQRGFNKKAKPEPKVNSGAKRSKVQPILSLDDIPNDARQSLGICLKTLPQRPANLTHADVVTEAIRNLDTGVLRRDILSNLLRNALKKDAGKTLALAPGPEQEAQLKAFHIQCLKTVFIECDYPGEDRPTLNAFHGRYVCTSVLNAAPLFQSDGGAEMFFANDQWQIRSPGNESKVMFRSIETRPVNPEVPEDLRATICGNTWAHFPPLQGWVHVDRIAKLTLQDARMDDLEEYMHGLSKLGQCYDRCDVWKYSQDVNDELQVCAESVKSCQRVIEAFEDANDGLKIVLAFVLAFGNVMNGGSSRVDCLGRADGFHLETLSRPGGLEAIKAHDGSNLRALILKTFFKENRADAERLLRVLTPVFASVQRTMSRDGQCSKKSGASLEDIQKRVEEVRTALKGKVNLLEEIIGNALGNGNEDDQFKITLLPEFQKKQKQLDQLFDSIQKLVQKFESIKEKFRAQTYTGDPKEVVDEVTKQKEFKPQKETTSLVVFVEFWDNFFVDVKQMDELCMAENGRDWVRTTFCTNSSKAITVNDLEVLWRIKDLSESQSMGKTRSRAPSSPEKSSSPAAGGEPLVRQKRGPRKSMPSKILMPKEEVRQARARPTLKSAVQTILFANRLSTATRPSASSQE